MKFLVCLIFATLSLTAWSETIKLMEFKSSLDKDVYSVMFRVNKPLQRAWVEVSIGESYGDSTYYDDTNIKIEGLSYNPEINGVVYNNGSEEIVCGTFYNQRWVIDGGMSFRKTGRCEFETRHFKRAEDDGFYVRQVKMTEVLLHIK